MHVKHLEQCRAPSKFLTLPSSCRCHHHYDENHQHYEYSPKGRQERGFPWGGLVAPSRTIAALRSALEGRAMHRSWSFYQGPHSCFHILLFLLWLLSGAQHTPTCIPVLPCCLAKGASVFAAHRHPPRQLASGSALAVLTCQTRIPSCTCTELHSLPPATWFTSFPGWGFCLAFLIWHLGPLLTLSGGLGYLPLSLTPPPSHTHTGAAFISSLFC